MQLIRAWSVALLFLCSLSLVYSKIHIVTSVEDDGSEDTLRHALRTLSAGDTVHFQIPQGHKLTPESPLPKISQDRVTIDGCVQGGSDYRGTPLVEISGEKIQPIEGDTFYHAGLVIEASFVTVRCLAINRFSNGISIKGNDNVIENNFIGTDPSGTVPLGNAQAGITIVGSRNRIGGNTKFARNVIVDNTNAEGPLIGAIYLPNGEGRENVIEGNYIGVDATGSKALGNGGAGVAIETNANIIRKNVISGNLVFGLSISGGENVVEGNLIGTDASGTFAVPNAVGVVVGFSQANNKIGGAQREQGNVIAGNDGPGLYLWHAPSTLVQNNLIGTDISGKNSVGNTGSGVFMEQAHDSVLSSNLISSNGLNGVNVVTTERSLIEMNIIGCDTSRAVALGNNGHGIRVSNSKASVIKGNTIRASGAAGVSILSNSAQITVSQNMISDNAGLGIDLDQIGVNENDNMDVDEGANSVVNFPTLYSAVVAGSELEVRGSYMGLANAHFTIEFFASQEEDSSSHGEGEVYIGNASVTTDSTGTSTFVVRLPFADSTKTVISAVATESSGASSEFSKSIRASYASPEAAAKISTSDSNNSEEKSTWITSLLLKVFGSVAGVVAFVMMVHFVRKPIVRFFRQGERAPLLSHH